jgi:hypothetical protein
MDHEAASVGGFAFLVFIVVMTFLFLMNADLRHFSICYHNH